MLVACAAGGDSINVSAYVPFWAYASGGAFERSEYCSPPPGVASARNAFGVQKNLLYSITPLLQPNGSREAPLGTRTGEFARTTPAGGDSLSS